MITGNPSRIIAAISPRPWPSSYGRRKSPFHLWVAPKKCHLPTSLMGKPDQRQKLKQWPLLAVLFTLYRLNKKNDWTNSYNEVSWRAPKPQKVSELQIVAGSKSPWRDHPHMLVLPCCPGTQRWLLAAASGLVFKTATSEADHNYRSIFRSSNFGGRPKVVIKQLWYYLSSPDTEKGHEFSMGVDNVDILECIIIYCVAYCQFHFYCMAKVSTFR